MITSDRGLTDPRVRLWRHDDQFLLYQRRSGQDSLYVVASTGNVILQQAMDLDAGQCVFLECGRILCLDGRHYYTLVLPDLDWESGERKDILPPGSISAERVHSIDTAFRVKAGNTIYTSSCVFEWVSIFTDNRLAAHSDIQFFEEESFLLYQSRKDYFLERICGQL